MTSAHSLSASTFAANIVDNDLSTTGDVAATKRSNALSTKLTSVLSSSYADSELRDALRLLHTRGAQSAEEARNRLKFDAQQEVIDVNARIVDDFGKVANQLKRVGALIAALNRTCDDMRTHIQLAKQETAPMLEEASTLLARKHEAESRQQLLVAFNQRFQISDEDLTVLTSSAEPVTDRYFVILSRVKQVHKDCEILLGYENQRLGLELLEQTTRNLDAGYKKLYNWIQREFKNLDLEDPHISGSIRRSLRALSERPTLFQNCLDFFGEARQVTLSEAFQKALTDSTLSSSKAIEFSTHDPLRYIGDMLAWVHSTTVSEKEALEGLFISDADEISRGLNAGKSSEPWARLRRTLSAANDAQASDDEDVESAEPSFDGHAALNSLISRNMASVAQVLNQRISLTMRNLTEPITVYKSYNLLLFYQDIFVKLLGVTHLNAQTPKQQPASKSEHHDENSLLAALSALQSQAINHFQAIVAEDIDAHSSSIDPTPTLQPPGILRSNLTLFSTILHLRAPNLTNSEFTSLYGILLAPVLELCGTAASSLSPDDDDDNDNIKAQQHIGARRSSSSALQTSPSFNSTIYRLNYMHAMHTTLTTLSQDSVLGVFVSAPLRSATQEITRLADDDLATTVTDRFLLASGVQDLGDLLFSSTDEQRDSQLQSPSKRATLLTVLEDASATLDSFLASALMDLQDDLGKSLTDKSLAKRTVAAAVESFCAEFEKVVAALDWMDQEEERPERDQEGQGVTSGHGHDGEEIKTQTQTETQTETDGEDDVFLRDLYPRTVGEVRALLS